jgi:histidyl-tRNA synthetase
MNNLVSFLDEKKDNLCEDCQRRITQNPLRVLDCKNENCQNELKTAPKITYNLCENCNKDFETLQNELKKLNIKYEVDTNLVRGLDYYNKTAFEFVSTEIGAQSAICGGGRYDKLVEMLDGNAVAAVGFAMGIERLLPLVNIENERNGIYLGVMIEEARDMALNKFNELTNSNKVYFENKVRKLNQHLKKADKLNCKKVMIIGEDELKNRTFWEKEL